MAQPKLIDEVDRSLIESHKWYIDPSTGYFRRTTVPHPYLHRLILNAKKGDICDHVNRNKLDNRRSNLRIVSASTSIHNKASKGNRLGVTGVYLHKCGKYAAEIRHEKKRYWLGLFTTIEEADNAYLGKRKELYGY